MKYTVFMLLTATPAWLSLTREQRNKFVESTLGPIMAKYEGRVQVRFYDAEAFSARCSDIATFEVDDLKDHYFLMEELRDTAMFAQPYFQVNEIIPSIENGFATFEEEAYNKQA